MSSSSMIRNPLSELTEVRASGTHGRGIFAKTLIARGTIWWSVRPSDLVHINQANFKTLTASVQSPEIRAFLDAVLHYSYYVKEHDALLFIPDNGRYVNHSFEPNSKPVNDQMSSIALRDIKGGEEIFE